MAKCVAYFNGVQIERGFKLTESGGGVWEFQCVTQPPEPGKSGKVYVTSPCGHEKENGKCKGLAWCRGEAQREFYPFVFDDLEIREA